MKILIVEDDTLLLQGLPTKSPGWMSGPTIIW